MHSKNSHSHCDNCFKLNCDHVPCKVIDCQHSGCEFRMHECKQQDHLDTICSRVHVPCINSEFGCNLFVLRKDLRIHLEKCPASIVACSFVNKDRLRLDSCCRWRRESKYKGHFNQRATRDDSTLTYHIEVEQVELANGEPRGFMDGPQLRPKQVCGSDFRRDEYCSHYQNVHCDIMPSLNGWMEKFCPNQQYGCTFNARRMQPICNAQRTQIVFGKQNNAFGHRVADDDARHSTNDVVSLTQLPVEVLTHILSYLDGFSLNSISLASKLLRSLCCNLLERRGTVAMIWKSEMKNGRISWIIAGYRWKFSNHFSLIKRWEFDDGEFLNHFSKDCKHFDKLIHAEPFQLIGIGIKKEKNSFL